MTFCPFEYVFLYQCHQPNRIVAIRDGLLIDDILQLVFQSLSTLPDDEHVDFTLIVNELLLILSVRAIRVLPLRIFVEC